MKFNITAEQFQDKIQFDPEIKFYGALTGYSGITFKRKGQRLLCSYWLIKPKFEELCRTSFNIDLVPKDWPQFEAFANKVTDHFRKYSENAAFISDLYLED